MTSLSDALKQAGFTAHVHSISTVAQKLYSPIQPLQKPFGIRELISLLLAEPTPHQDVLHDDVTHVDIPGILIPHQDHDDGNFGYQDVPAEVVSHHDEPHVDEPHKDIGHDDSMD